MDNAIEAKSLRKSYKDVSVLEDVSFSVQKGTVFALLGSNGAGKTTTINILTTLIRADGGTATVAGHDVAARPDKVRKEISLTGQFAAVDDRLTGRENLLLIGDLRHVADPAETATDLLRRFGLEEAADRRVSTYLRRDAPPPRHRHEPDRQSCGHLPGRAHQRVRPGGSQ